MNDIGPEQLLNQIRSLGKALQAPVSVPGDTPGTSGFSEMLTTSLNAVNDLQQHAGEMKAGFENGTADASLAEVMIAAQKANLSFLAVTEVRNKLVQAYQDIMNMPV